MRRLHTGTALAAALALSACAGSGPGGNLNPFNWFGGEDPNRTAQGGTSADTERGRGSPAIGTTSPVSTTAAAGVHGPQGSVATTGVPATAGMAGTVDNRASGTPTGGTGMSGASGTSGAGGMSGTSGMSALSAADRAYIHSTAHAGMAEVEFGRMAQQKASSSAVRDFGQRMVREHTQANQELMQLASRYGITPQPTLDRPHQAAMEALQQLSGPAFDRQYLEQQYAGHAAMLTASQFAAERASSSDLRNFAQRQVSTVQQHLDQIRSIWPTAMSGAR